LIGVLLLAPESYFSERLRGLFWTLQDSVVAVFDAAGTAFRSLGDGFASM
jgi:hypothetical protein